MLRINNRVTIDFRDIEFKYTRSPKPGGQNVNKVETGVQLRFDITGSEALSDEVKDRLIRLAGGNVTSKGVLIMSSSASRSREQNRRNVLERFRKLVQKALEKPARRIPTKTPYASRIKRLENKKKRSIVKKLRKYEPDS